MLFLSLLNNVILIFSELSKTLNLDGGDIEVSDLLVKTVSAIKKLERKGKVSALIQMFEL